MKSKTLELLVDGIHCEHCQMSVFNALSNIYGIYIVNVSLFNGKVTVTYNPEYLTEESVVEAIEKIGYKVLNHKK